MAEDHSFRDWFRVSAPASWEEWRDRLDDPQLRDRLTRLITNHRGEVNDERDSSLEEGLEACPGLASPQAMAEEEYTDFLNAMRRVLRSKKRMVAPDLKNSGWKPLYKKLETILSSHGCVGDPGRGDFYIVDYFVTDECTHKIEVKSIELLTPELARQIRESLQGSSGKNSATGSSGSRLLQRIIETPRPPRLS